MWKGENHNDRMNVLNGIAYDPEKDRLFLTMKRWPLTFGIDLVPRGAVFLQRI